MVYCKICKRKFSNYKSLSAHVVNKHNIKSKDYYDLFYKTNINCICKICGKKTTYRKMETGYSTYCSSKCAHLDPNLIKTIKQTCLKKYGVDNPFKSDEIKEKIKFKMVEKYGVDSPMKNKNIRYKSKQTCLKKYGVDNPFKSDEIKEKIKFKMVEKYGVEYAQQSNIVKEKDVKTCNLNLGVDYPTQSNIVKEKIKQTCLQKYGVTSHNKLPNVKLKKIKTCIKNWGVENPSQSDEIHKKQNACKFKEYKFKSGNIIKVQGYEPQAIDILLSDGYSECKIYCGDRNKIPTIKFEYMNKNKVYFPDIYIPDENLIIEVKSYWTYSSQHDLNIAKEQACKDQGYKFQFMIL